MLAEARPDVVHVLASPRTHPDLIRRSLAAGAHVICEKPPAPSATETAALLRSARDAGRALVETSNLLYNDVVLEFDRALAAGGVGEPREIDVSLALDLGGADVPQDGLGLPGGIAHDYLPHLAYLLLHFAGQAEVTDLMGTLRNATGVSAIGYDHVDALVPARRREGAAADLAGCAAELDARRGTWHRRFAGGRHVPAVPASRGPTLGWQVVARRPHGPGSCARPRGGRNVRDRLLQHGTYHGMARMLAALYTALRDGDPLPISEQDVMASALLIDRVVELAGTNR